jgi:hypothetical protein
MWGGTLLAVSLAASAGNDGVVELRTKALASASAASNSVLAGPMSGSTRRLDEPFLPSHDPLPAIMQEVEPVQHASSSRCDANASLLCYDAADGRLVYRGAREYMPKVSGLSPESVSVRRNTVVFKYSFR